MNRQVIGFAHRSGFITWVDIYFHKLKFIATGKTANNCVFFESNATAVDVEGCFSIPYKLSWINPAFAALFLLNYPSLRIFYTRDVISLNSEPSFVKVFYRLKRVISKVPPIR